jgi:hypothetical protein
LIHTKAAGRVKSKSIEVKKMDLEKAIEEDGLFGSGTDRGMNYHTPVFDKQLLVRIAQSCRPGEKFSRRR